MHVLDWILSAITCSGNMFHQIIITLREWSNTKLIPTYFLHFFDSNSLRKKHLPTRVQLLPKQQNPLCFTDAKQQTRLARMNTQLHYIEKVLVGSFVPYFLIKLYCTFVSHSEYFMFDFLFFELNAVYQFLCQLLCWLPCQLLCPKKYSDLVNDFTA